MRGIHRGPVNSPHKWPVTRKMFPFDDVIMSVAQLDIFVSIWALGAALSLVLGIHCYRLDCISCAWSRTFIISFTVGNILAIYIYAFITPVTHPIDETSSVVGLSGADPSTKAYELLMALLILWQKWDELLNRYEYDRKLSNEDVYFWYLCLFSRVAK